MKVFLDSSALAKRYIEESGSKEVDLLLSETTSLGVCILCVPEIISALCRRRREGVLSKPMYGKAKKALLQDVADAEVVQITPSVVRESLLLLEGQPLRAMDALHVASALVWGAELFATSDRRQVTAASRSGLRAEEIG
jgi:predicted nucleic acid-binding protein